MKLLILLGGASNEREVSLRSGKAVSDALKAAGHEVLEYDPKDGFVGLASFVGKVDCVFPILHGKGGEDGEVQAELEKLGFKYLGADSRASKLCYDKVEFKKILNKLSILTPKGEVVSEESIKTSAIIDRPYVLKQSYDPKVFKNYKRMLLEELIEGTEITVSILGDSSLPVIEIIPPEGKEFDYENKYNGATQEICPPENVSENIQQAAQKLAELIHKEVGVRHLSRTDIIIDKEDKLWVLELNTIPGLTFQSLFPKAAKTSGISFEDLVQKFLDLTLEQNP
jgi:D-alanine-D-alanine ligase